MQFIDEVKVQVRGGDGGSGAVLWRREKFIPRGGPDGGDGGAGGAVIFVAEPGLTTLIDFSFQPLLSAQAGAQGEDNRKHGKSGADLICPVPVGTQVFSGDTLAADLSVSGARWIAARGGNGGKGNAFFKSSTNQAPDYAQPGQPGEAYEYRLVLKCVADVGLVGFPNVGKSTLITVVSSARPAVADYPFTTLTPHLGVVTIPDGRRFVAADIPGLIPGAHKGRGLGTRFLRHVERTSLLLQLIDVTVHHEDLAGPKLEEFRTEMKSAGLSGSPEDEELILKALAQYLLIDRELAAFSQQLLEKPRIIAFSKGDLPENIRAYELTKTYFDQRAGSPPELISSMSSLGVEELKLKVFQRLAVEKISLLGQKRSDTLNK